MRNAGKALVVIVFLLLTIGFLLLASASSVKGMDEAGDSYYYVKKQLFWLFLGLLGATGAAFFDYHWLHNLKLNLFLVGGTAVLLLLVFAPHIGKCIKGSHRWIALGGFSIQPSEFAKLTIVIMLSTWMTLKGRFASNFKQGLAIPLLSLGAMLVLLLAEPDYGTTFLLAAVGAGIMFMGGSRTSHLVASGVLGLMLFALAIMHNPNRLIRFLSFIFREHYPDAVYQLTQSETAFALGGIWGQGWLKSMQKLYFLPEAHNDFIFAILGEEMGLFATLAVVLLFLLLMLLGMRISRRAPDRFGSLLAFGMTMLLSLEAIINIGVVTGCLPTKGLALPFMSAGGSSMISSLMAVGVLLNVARHIETADDHMKPIKDKDLSCLDDIQEVRHDYRVRQT